jgi:hypothetical protein
MKLRIPKIHEIEMKDDTILMVVIDDQSTNFVAAGPLTRSACESVWKSAVKRGVII